MTENKQIDEKVTERHIEVTGDDVAPGTNNPQPAPENPQADDAPKSGDKEQSE